MKFCNSHVGLDPLLLNLATFATVNIDPVMFCFIIVLPGRQFLALMTVVEPVA
jgi:hypothetical protein